MPIGAVIEQINNTYNAFSADGYRTLGVAYKTWNNNTPIYKEDEKEMVIAGFISLFNPYKKGIKGTVVALNSLGIKLKVITGDNLVIAKSMAAKVGLDNVNILSGSGMKNMSIEVLRYKIASTDIFAEVEPVQKQLIILMLKKMGNVVGYMGDGINDTTALKAADVGISVNTAVDVAKEAADLVLLDLDLNVSIEGVNRGRRTFANTQKYIFMATSTNFSHMFSMAGASFFSPFLPLLPQQILLINLMTDLPAMTISTNDIDDD